MTPENTTPERAHLRRTFAALRVHNFRLYAAGQLVSNSGTWMQSLAQGWLILTLTHSGFMLGLVLAAQYLPLLLLGPWCGLVVDRMSKRRLLYVTQTTLLLLALLLYFVVAFTHVHVWEILTIAAMAGVAAAFDTPVRQTFVQEMVGRDLLPNAVSLNASTMNTGRIIGPALAGLTIGLWGIPTCFAINAVSYLAILIALLSMRRGELAPITREGERGRGQVREGLRYVAAHRDLASVLIAVTLVGTLTFNYTTVLPLLIRTTFHHGAGAYGIAMSCMGVGALLGGLFIAQRPHPKRSVISSISFVFAGAVFGVALAPTQLVADVLLVPMGAAGIAFMVSCNALLQLRSEERFRGRVMALYSIAFLGTTPIGAPLMGWVSQVTSPRWGLFVGAVSALGAGLVLLLAVRRTRRDL
jgi:MFS family permease